jgi:hypothetical protein
MTEALEHLVLINDLNRWDVTLRTGEVLTVWAHGVSERDGDHVFVAFMEGTPVFEREICKIPNAVVPALLGG